MYCVGGLGGGGDGGMVATVVFGGGGMEGELYIATGSHPDNAAQTGDQGDRGATGHAGSSKDATKTGKSGTIVEKSSKDGCLAFNSVGVLAAFDVARIKLIEKMYTDGIALIEDVLAIAQQRLTTPGIATSDAWYNVYSEGLLLLNKFEQDRYLTERDAVIVPSLSPSLYKENTKLLLTTERGE